MDKDFKCQYCNKPFNRKFNLNRHSNSCKKKDLYNCNKKKINVILTYIYFIDDRIKNKNNIKDYLLEIKYIFEKILKKMSFVLLKKIENIFYNVKDYLYKFINLINFQKKKNYKNLLDDFKKNCKINNYNKLNLDNKIVNFIEKNLKKFIFLSEEYINN